MITTLKISYETYLDMINIKEGVFSPLDKFMNYNDLNSVVCTNRLENDEIWSIPIIQPIEDITYPEIREGDEYDLSFEEDNDKLGIVGTIKVEEKYKIDKHNIAEKVFKTLDKRHPGVNLLFKGPNYAVSGKLKFCEENLKIKDEFHLSPEETKKKFKQNGWKTIVGFQTRNVPHLAHEYLQRCGLEMVDGLFLQPINGWKKLGDYRAEIVFEAYKNLINYYYPKNRVLLCSLSTAMRYAGPREALFHAAIRRNYGCTHFIVGRDHAGVGDYYGKYDAHKIFENFEDIGIIPMLLCEPFYCKKCDMMATEKTCLHEDSQRIHMSGTYIRNSILNGGKIPEKIMRKEVVDVLKYHLNNSEYLFY
jgi:sulfate adenylyltransferase